VSHYLLPAGEDPPQRQAAVRQGVHEGGVGVRQQGLEVPVVHPSPLLGQPRLLWLPHAIASCLGLGESCVVIVAPLLHRLVHGSLGDGGVDNGVVFRLVLHNTCT